MDINPKDDTGVPVEEVANFLQKRECNDDVVQRFLSEKMDQNAICSSSDQDLVNLGLTAKGDILALRAFFLNKTSISDSNLLKSIVEDSGRLAKTEVKKRTVALGWKHYSIKERKYKLIKDSDGGGVRTLKIPENATINDLLTIAKNLFNLKGHTKYGFMFNMQYFLATFSLKKVEEHLEIDGKSYPFTLKRYIQKYKNSKTRLYIFTKKKYSGLAWTDLSEGKEDADFQYDMQEDAGFEPDIQEKADFQPDILHSTLAPSSNYSVANDSIRNNQVQTSDGLIGTSSERLLLRERIEAAYQESLYIDQLKANSTEKKASFVANDESDSFSTENVEMSNIQSIRMSRLCPEPEVWEDHVVLTVRHPNIGIMRRLFPTNAKAIAVYDWVGLKAADPLYFSLYCYNREVEPNDSIINLNHSCLSVIRRTTPICFEDEDKIDNSTSMVFNDAHENDNVPTSSGYCFRKKVNCPIRFRRSIGSPCLTEYSIGNTNAVHGLAYTSNGTENMASVTESVANGIAIVNGSARSSNGIASIVNGTARSVNGTVNIANGVTDYRTADIDNLIDNSVVEPMRTADEISDEGIHPTRSFTFRIHRIKIKVDMVNAFKENQVKVNDDIIYKFVDPMGKEEAGVGSGVSRDVYSSFWLEASNSLLIGETERVPFVRHDMYKSEWTAIGVILAKGYLDHGYFPTVLSRCFVKYCMFGAVSEKDLLESFKLYVSNDEKTLLNSVLKTDPIGIDKDDCEELHDFLDAFKCRTLISKDNIYLVICEIARQELIQKPHIMASCWKETFIQLRNVLPDEKAIDQLYGKVEPTNKKIIKLLEANPVRDAERESLGYLKRYIKGLPVIELKKLLKFLTGSDLIVVSTIEISFNSAMSEFERRPIAHTCGPVLELPSTYNNFCELRAEFANILNENNWEIDIV